MYELLEKKINFNKTTLKHFVNKWKIGKIYVFGSVLRDDFAPESDIDILISPKPETNWTLFDHIEMKEELENIFNRKVDLLTKSGIENSKNEIRKNEILSKARLIYEN